MVSEKLDLKYEQDYLSAKKSVQESSGCKLQDERAVGNLDCLSFGFHESVCTARRRFWIGDIASVPEVPFHLLDGADVPLCTLDCIQQHVVRNNEPK